MMEPVVIVVRDPMVDTLAKLMIKSADLRRAAHKMQPFMNDFTLSKYKFNNLYGKTVQVNDKLADWEIQFAPPVAPSKKPA